MSETIDEAIVRKDGPVIANLRTWVAERHGVTEPDVQDRMIAGFATAYLVGEESLEVIVAAYPDASMELTPADLN